MVLGVSCRGLLNLCVFPNSHDVDDVYHELTLFDSESTFSCVQLHVDPSKVMKCFAEFLCYKAYYVFLLMAISSTCAFSFLHSGFDGIPRRHQEAFVFEGDRSVPIVMGYLGIQGGSSRVSPRIGSYAISPVLLSSMIAAKLASLP
ncbi:hypothetical protein Tco_1123771 [Tanacetum coccineum]